jgi:hypothetical protein
MLEIEEYKDKAEVKMQNDSIHIPSNIRKSLSIEDGKSVFIYRGERGFYVSLK